MLISVALFFDIFVFAHFLKSFWAYFFIALEGDKGVGGLIINLYDDFLATQVMQLNSFSDKSSLTLVQRNFSPLFWHF